MRSLAITCGAVWCNHQAVLDAHVERGGGSMSALPGKWTFAVQQPMSAKGQKRTSRTPTAMRAKVCWISSARSGAYGVANNSTSQAA